jgi:serine/threonine protein kinase
MNDKDFSPKDLPLSPIDSFGGSCVKTDLSSFWNLEENIDETKQLPTSESRREEGLLLPSGYRLRNVIGRGGFGEVWAAEQTSLCRVVAVKRLHRARANRELDSGKARELVGEFRKEAITSANLEHPNIVPVHDIVMDEAGEPLLCMKLIQGQTWNRLIEADIEKLSLEDHLARHIPILIAVAQAVAFAHSRGVMHRDLKPSQVIIGEYGEVVLGDWGLALAFDTKLLGTHSGDGAQNQIPTKSQASNPGGTAGYMAPEQTNRTCEGLGPWTDVYLLGGTIFTILTGVPPHNAKSGHRAFEMATKGEIIPLDSGAKFGELPEELLSLMYRALEPDPAKRVSSAKEFVALLQEFMSGAGRRRESTALAASAEAQLALQTADYSALATAEGNLVRALTLWPGNTSARELKVEAIARHGEAALANNDLTLAQLQADRLGDSPRKAKLVEEVRKAVEAGLERESQRRRLRTSLRVTGAAFMLVASVLGALAFRSAVRADAEAARANERAIEATHAREVADSERLRANARANEAREARDRAEGLVNFLVVDLQDSLLPMGRTSLMKRVAEKSSQYFSQRPTSEMSETELNQFAISQRNMSDIFATLGEMDEAREALSKGLAALEDSTHGGSSEQLAFKAGLQLRMSSLAQRELDVEGSARRIEDAASIIPNVTDEKVRRELVLDLLAQRSQLLQLRGDTRGAISLLREGIALTAQAEGGEGYGERSIVISQLNRSLASCQYRVGEIEDAIESQSRAVSLSRSEYQKRASNEDTLLARELVAALTGLSEFLYVRGQVEEAFAAYREALKTSESLAAIDPFNSIAALDLASIRTRFAIALRDQGRHAEAREQCERSIESLDPFAAFPNPETQLLAELALASSELGRICIETDDMETAGRQLGESVSIRETLAMRQDAGTAVFADAGDAFRELADFQVAEGQNEAALASYQSAQVYLERALASDAKSITARRSLSLVRTGQGQVLVSTEQFDEAIEAMRDALNLADEVMADNQKSRFDVFNSVYINEILVMTLNSSGRYSEARQASDYSVKLLEDYQASAEGDVSTAYSLVPAYLNQAVALIGMEDYAAATAVLDRANKVAEQALAIVQSDPNLEDTMTAIFLTRSRIKAKVDGAQTAEAMWLSALDLLAESNPEGDRILNRLLRFEANVHLRRVEEARKFMPRADMFSGFDAEFRKEVRALGLWPE